MPQIASLECSRCHHHVSAEAPQTLCPLCAGSLYVRYDMDALKPSTSRGSFARGRRLEGVHVIADIERTGAERAEGLRGFSRDVVVAAGAFQGGDLRHVSMVPEAALLDDRA